MKKSSVYVPGLMLISSTILFSCTKTDISGETVPEVNSKKKIDCQVTAFRYTNAEGNKYVFKKQIDPSTGNLKQITAALYQGGAITSTINLDVHWNTNSVAFIKSGSATDTVLVASLNADGKPVNVVAGNTPDFNYLPTSFEYQNNRLSAMNVSLAGNINVSRFSYDNKNNCTLIQDDSRSGEVPGRVEYTYENRRADQQMYLDEPRPYSWNTFSLMQFAGLLPELQPTNVRSSVKVWWANNYKVYDVQLTNHNVNAGTLVKYDVTFTGGSTSIPYFIDTQCDAGLAGRN